MRDDGARRARARRRLDRGDGGEPARLCRQVRRRSERRSCCRMSLSSHAFDKLLSAWTPGIATPSGWARATSSATLVDAIPASTTHVHTASRSQRNQALTCRYVDYVLNRSVAQQYQAFFEGLMMLCKGPAITLFSPVEMERLVCGNPHLDFAALRGAAKYEAGFSASVDAVVWLWDIAQNVFDLGEKRMFLKFFTGATGKSRPLCLTVAWVRLLLVVNSPAPPPTFSVGGRFVHAQLHRQRFRAPWRAGGRARAVSALAAHCCGPA